MGSVRICPQCGSSVEIAIADERISFSQSDEERLDRIAHAVCGCFVYSMADGQIGRLLAFLLAREVETPSAD